MVIGVGGYSSGPVVALAALRGMPTLLMEQNAMPGLTNRLLARLVERGGGDLRGERRVLRRQGVRGGNPVRPEFFEARRRMTNTVRRQGRLGC